MPFEEKTSMDEQSDAKETSSCHSQPRGASSPEPDSQLAAAFDDEFGDFGEEDWQEEKQANPEHNLAGIEQAQTYPSHGASDSDSPAPSTLADSDGDLDAMADAMFEDWEAKDFGTDASPPANENIPTLQQIQEEAQTQPETAAPASVAAAVQQNEATTSTGKRKKIEYTDFEGLDDDDDDDYSTRNGVKDPPTVTSTITIDNADITKRRKVAVASNSNAHANGTSSCQHPSYWAGLCVQCGAPKPDENALAIPVTDNHTSQLLQKPSPRSKSDKPAATTTRIKHLHAKGHLEVSAQEAERLRQLEVSRLLSNQKLVLILDLDHTLLNSVRMVDVPDDQRALLEKILDREKDQADKLLFCFSDKNLWTKLRPGIHKFLNMLRPLFEMHIYTMGDRSYANLIRRALDPDNRMFASAISQCDSTSRAAKDLDVALADERLVIILDDTSQVWPRHQRNLIQVDRYHYFAASQAQWGQSGISLLESGKDESSNDGALAVCGKVLVDVHEKFFAPSNPDPLTQRDARYCLSQRRQEILHGCVLVFSRIWPMDMPEPYTHPLWILAESLGAECMLYYESDRTTHVVTTTAATAKGHQALSEGKNVVTPEWVKASMYRWERQPEEKFAAPVTSSSRATPPPPQAAAAANGHTDDAQVLSMALASAGRAE